MNSIQSHARHKASFHLCHSHVWHHHTLSVCASSITKLTTKAGAVFAVRVGEEGEVVDTSEEEVARHLQGVIAPAAPSEARLVGVEEGI